MNKQRLLPSIARRKMHLGRQLCGRYWSRLEWGSVVVSDLRRSVAETLLPTGDSRRVLLEMAVLPPL